MSKWSPKEDRTNYLRWSEQLTPEAGTAGYLDPPDKCLWCLQPIGGKTTTLEVCGVTVTLPSAWVFVTEIQPTTYREIHTGNYDGISAWNKAEYWQGPELIPLTFIVPAPTTVANYPFWTSLSPNVTADSGVYETLNDFDFSTTGTANVSIACEPIENGNRIHIRATLVQRAVIAFHTNPANAVNCAGTVGHLATGDVSGLTTTSDSVSASATAAIYSFDVLSSEEQVLDLSQLEIELDAEKSSETTTPMNYSVCANGTTSAAGPPRTILSSTYEIAWSAVGVPT